MAAGKWDGTAGPLTTEKMDQIATSCIRTHTTVWHACMDHFKEK